MSVIDDILLFNKNFVESGDYESYRTSKYPNKKIAILSCMDTRLSLLLPAALGVKNGDVKIIKNAGALVSHPYGSVMRSLLVCIYELGIDNILVIGHYDCGMQNLCSDKMTEKMIEAGISKEAIEKVKSEIDYGKWLSGFDSVEQSVLDTVAFIRSHPLIPNSINVTGLIMDPDTGRLDKAEA
ncbi:MAG: carbonic anhydrase [Clostridiales bacterium]|jgi:carbonic anhydrase|nr:carbonic anhydrase [Clostridiales bacterium]